MAKKPADWNPAADLEWVDSLSFEEMATVKEALSEKMESQRHHVAAKLKDDFQKQMTLYGLSPEDLGFSQKTAKQSARKRSAPTEACKICGFMTDKNHDARAHRSQEQKRPFTDTELAERGMSKV